MADGSEVSERWAGWRAALPIDEYEARFERALAQGNAVHGEADFIASLGPASVLDAGCGTGRVAIELARRGIEVVGVDLDIDMLAAARRKAPHIVWDCVDLSVFDLGRPFDVVAMPGNVMIFCRAEHRAPIVARCAAHVATGGALVAGFSLESSPGSLTVDEYDAACAAAGLELEQHYAGWGSEPFTGAGYLLSVHRRPR